MARNPRSERLTRAQRRVLEREQEKQRKIEARRQVPKRFSRLTLAGGALTIVAVLAIVIYAVLRNNAGTATSPNVNGLADPSSLHPNASLLAVGTKAPIFTLHDVNGKRYSLHVYMGQPMVLEFFAVWCPVCHAEAPAMARLTSAYVPKGVHVWSVLANGYGRDYENSGRTDLRPVDAGDLGWYARTYTVRDPQLIDPTFAVTNEYGAGAYPTIYILDADGAIRYASQGRVSYARLSGALNRVMHATMPG